jgi:cytochrome c oxidase assembly protein subunit 15
VERVRIRPFARYAWGVLGYTVAVILWGAYVRATGSGAGCGSHWPLCNGVVIPASPRIETLVEFTHRVSSGLTLVLVVGLVVWGVRSFPRGHPVRLGLILSGLFVVSEAALGAGLVLFELVAENASAARAIAVAAHLVNTFLLLGALTLTAWWATTGKKLTFRNQGSAVWILALSMIGVLILGMTGAVTALGDTLFPPASLAQGIQQDLSPTTAFLVRLRVFHPLLAMLVAFGAGAGALTIRRLRPDLTSSRLAVALIGLFGLQLVAGLTNIVLLAPIWLQQAHLLLADLVWVDLVLLAASSLAAPDG